MQDHIYSTENRWNNQEYSGKKENVNEGLWKSQNKQKTNDHKLARQLDRNSGEIR